MVDEQVPDDIKKVFEKTKKTAFSAIIPTICLSMIKEKPRHGYEIMKKGNELIGKHIMECIGTQEELLTPSNTYPILHDLEEKELLKSEWEKRKKYYHITTKGLKAYEQRKKTIKKIMLTRIQILGELFDEEFVEELLKEASK